MEVRKKGEELREEYKEEGRNIREEGREKESERRRASGRYTSGSASCCEAPLPPYPYPLSLPLFKNNRRLLLRI